LKLAEVNEGQVVTVAVLEHEGANFSVEDLKVLEARVGTVVLPMEINCLLAVVEGAKRRLRFWVPLESTHFRLILAFDLHNSDYKIIRVENFLNGKSVGKYLI
jgi:hypothetical protein